MHQQTPHKKGSKGDMVCARRMKCGGRVSQDGCLQEVRANAVVCQDEQIDAHANRAPYILEGCHKEAEVCFIIRQRSFEDIKDLRAKDYE